MKAIKLLRIFLFNPFMFYVSTIIALFLSIMTDSDLHLLIASIPFYIIIVLNAVFCPGIADDPLSPYFKPLPHNSQGSEENTSQDECTPPKEYLYEKWSEILRITRNKNIDFTVSYRGTPDLFGEILKQYDQDQGFDPIYIRRILLIYSEICIEIKNRIIKDLDKEKKLLATLARLNSDLVEHWEDYLKKEQSRFNTSLNSINKFMDLKGIKSNGIEQRKPTVFDRIKQFSNFSDRL